MYLQCVELLEVSGGSTDRSTRALRRVAALELEALTRLSDPAGFFVVVFFNHAQKGEDVAGRTFCHGNTI